MVYVLDEGKGPKRDGALFGLGGRGRGAAGPLRVASPSLRITLAGARRHDANLDVGRVELTGSGSPADTPGAGARADPAPPPGRRPGGRPGGGGSARIPPPRAAAAPPRGAGSAAGCARA